MELDDNVFSDGAFDCYAWLEEAVIDRSGNIPELVHMVPQLSLLSQSLTKSIHGTLHQLTIAGPQIQAQLDAMQRVTAPLSQQLDAVASTVAHASPAALSSRTTDQSVARKKEQDQDLEHLLSLHEAKERLQSCAKALVEAARWEKNVRACAASIEGASAAAAAAAAVVAVASHVNDKKASNTSTTTLAERVDEMRTSLEILKDMPGADDRKRTMERLLLQIEAAMKPILDEYLQATQLPVAQVQFCRDVFASIGRSEYVVQAYCRCRPAQIHRMWYTYSATDDTFGKWLDGFYPEVARMIHQETNHATQLFGSEGDRVLVELLENTLAALKESFRERLKHGFSVDQLLLAYQTSCGFVSQVAKALRTNESILELDDEQQEEEEDEGVDQAQSSKSARSRETADRILVAVLGPYQPFFLNYAQFATESLVRKQSALVPAFSSPTRTTSSHHSHRASNDDDENDDLAFGGGGDGSSSSGMAANALETYAQQLEDVSSELWAAVEESVRQCFEFSGGAAFPDAVVVVSQAVDQLVGRLVETLPAVRTYLGMDNKPAHHHQHGGGSGLLMADWGRFHAALALLRACGTIESDLAVVHKRLCVRMQEQTQRLVGFTSTTTTATTASSHKTSPRLTKRKELKRRSSGGGTLTLSMLASDSSKITSSIVVKWLKDEPEKHKALMAFVQDIVDLTSGNGSSHGQIFADAQSSLARYTRHVQTLVYDAVFSRIAHILATVPTLPCWTTAPNPSLGDLPTFSTLPQEYITMVADLLLSLLPQLEPFAESSSLQKAACASHGAYKVCTREWTTLGKLLHLTSHQVDKCARVLDDNDDQAIGGQPHDHDHQEGGGGSANSEAAVFVDLWTSAVASGTTAALVTAVATIPTLSPLGATQLAADVGYFQNVLHALTGGGGGGGGAQGDGAHFLLAALQQALHVPESEYAAFVDELRSRVVVGAASAQGEAEANKDEHGHQQITLRLHECLLAKRLPAARQQSPATTGGNHQSSGSSTVKFY